MATPRSSVRYRLPRRSIVSLLTTFTAPCSCCHHNCVPWTGASDSRCAPDAAKYVPDFHYALLEYTHTWSYCIPLSGELILPVAFAGSKQSPPFIPILLALIGGRSKSENGEELSFTNTERIDFAILSIVFGVLVGAISSFSILINQIVSYYFLV